MGYDSWVFGHFCFISFLVSTSTPFLHGYFKIATIYWIDSAASSV